MNVTSATQTQYISSVSKTQNEETSYEEVAQKKQFTRYEVLMGMNYDNMSEAEKKERFHYFAMRPMPFLDEEGNKALNKSLEGKTDIEKSQIKSVLQLSFMTSVKVNHDNHTVDRQKFDSIDTSKSATVDRFEKFMEDFPKNGSIDNIGLMDVMDKFLNIYKASDPSIDIKNQENSVVDKFLEDLYFKGSAVTASAIIKETIQNKVNEYAQTLMDTRGDTPESKLEIFKMLNDYKKELLSDYKKSLDGATNDNITLEQQAIIKVLMDENTQEASSLEKLLATKEVAKTDSVTATTLTSVTDDVAKTEATGRMAEMQEKYKDVYTPIPETYSVKDEELQARKIYEAYPNYISGPDFLQIVSSFLEGTRIELGQKLTAAQEEAQKLDYAQAFQKAYDIFGGEEEFIAMQKGSMEIMKKYPVNTWGKDERVHNATELARFTNAATYEGLEQGKTIEEARIYAGNLMSSFMDTSYSVINFLETLIKAGRADPDSLKWFLEQDEKYYPKNPNDIDFNYVNNQTMDLRKYGIEGSWEYYEKPEDQKAMIAEIEKKIGQFNFMLNNENLIKDAYSQLVADAQNLGNNAGYKKMINDDYMPRMVDGLNIFKNYTIYD